MLPGRARPLVFWLSLALLAPSAVWAQLPRAERPEEVGLSSHRLERLTEALEQYVAEGRLPGGVALVARKGKVAYLRPFGYRDLEAEDPMQTDSIFRIASQTKALVSVGVMILQEEGKLVINEPLAFYLPEFRETTVAVAKADAEDESGDDDDSEGDGEDEPENEDEPGYEIVKANRPILIRDLLTHTAGIGYGNGPAQDRWAEAGIQGWYFADRDEPIGETISRMAELPIDAQPGEDFVYGYSTDILGVLIERVSGLSLDQFLHQRILQPLGMDDTHFYLPESKRDRLSVVYSAAENGLEKAPDPGGMVGQGAYVDGPRKSFSGGAGLLSTADDYALFLQMMLEGGALGQHRILGRKTVEVMTVDHLKGKEISPGVGFGLGFSIVKDLGARGVPGSVGEFGWGGAYHSSYWVDPEEELVVVYFTQLIPAGRIADHLKLRALVYQAIVD
ncbi:MAG TPA: serine hydrolase domain-containing protein [Acidobacteriota bacterium]|nr:serine hydrolase domain-containing protein [Acidobacteriota bacterium]